jgi:hypothetical protein
MLGRARDGVSGPQHLHRKLVECLQISFSFHTIHPTKPIRQTRESVTMATFQSPAQRLIIAGGFAVAVAAAPAVAVFAAPTASTPVPLAQCPGGESNDLYTDICIPHMVPNAGSPYQSIPGNPDLASVAGIPCAGHNMHQCIALTEGMPVHVQQPQSSVSSSPTVTGHTGP